MKAMTAIDVFGDTARRYLMAVEKLANEAPLPIYSFLAADDWEQRMRTDPAQGMSIYWRETFARAHMSSLVSIIRGLRWTAGMTASADAANLPAFAACARGFLENAADTADGLMHVGVHLAEHREAISRMLAGDVSKGIMIAKELEDVLIHFSHARRVASGEDAHKSHQAKKTTEYREILERGGVPHVGDLYYKLCDFCHAGYLSVVAFLEGKPGGEFRVSRSTDTEWIVALCDEYRETFANLCSFAFNPALVTLKVLCAFPLGDFRCPAIEPWDLRGIPAWSRIDAALRVGR